jgi:hypothetical protein
MLQLNLTDIVAGASAVVALCALAVSVWQGMLARRHHVLSVKPHIDIVSCATEIEGNYFSLKNAGLGPAIIEEISVHRSEKVIHLKSKKDFIALVQLLECDVHKTSGSFLAPGQTMALSAGESVEIFRMTSAEHSQPLRDTFGRTKNLVDVVVKFKCMYGIRYESHYVGSSHDA